MWSEGGWTGPNYAVAYAIGTSPFGPFERVGKILQQDPAVATGAGHHSVLQAPTSGKWYIVYHRRPLGETDRNHRVVCIDELRFDEQGRDPAGGDHEGRRRRRSGSGPVASQENLTVHAYATSDHARRRPCGLGRHSRGAGARSSECVLGRRGHDSGHAARDDTAPGHVARFSSRSI